MKVQARVEKELFRAIDKKEYLKKHMTIENILKLDERIKVLKWILSDLDDKLPEIYL